MLFAPAGRAHPASLAARLAATRNRSAGFDWLRLGLATAVVSWHTIVITGGLETQRMVFADPVVRPVIAALLGMFFTLSGFLVAGSLERCRTLLSFAGLRLLRIFPALVVEVLLSAFILGPFVTALPPADYLADPLFAGYLMNALGIIQFELPQVFLANPLPGVVNGQLWTVPFELRCYEALCVLALLGLYRRRWLMLAALAAAVAYMLRKPGCDTCVQDVLTGNVLVLCFLVGVVLYRFRDLVPWSRALALLSLPAAWALLASGGRGDVLAAIPLGYLTVYLGLCNPPRLRILFSGDYSYGIFLYGYPVQQMVASLGEGWTRWYVHLPASLSLVAGIAVFSWWCIEKPVLGLRPALLATEDRMLGAWAFARAQMHGARARG